MSEYSSVQINVHDESHKITKPTYFKSTDFFYAWQNIVDTYGIPTYGEASPVPISIVTFPFFFGMMFGDMGHGSLLLLVGSLLIIFNDRIKGSAAGGAGGIRYLLFLMGFFAVYCGAVYNEWFAINTSIFESCYNPERVQWGKAEGREGGQWVYTRKSFDCTVAFG